jgi:hypothetical protein
MKLYRCDDTRDDFGPYVIHWYCEPPEVGERYLVIDEVWEGDSIRNIFEIVRQK